jgi:hypothetical protein
VRKDESRAWKTTKIFYGDKRRKIRHKEVTEVYWQRGAGQRRLIVITPRLAARVRHRARTCCVPGSRPSHGREVAALSKAIAAGSL